MYICAMWCCSTTLIINPVRQALFRRRHLRYRKTQDGDDEQDGFVVIVVSRVQDYNY